MYMVCILVYSRQILYYSILYKFESLSTKLVSKFVYSEYKYLVHKL